MNAQRRKRESVYFIDPELANGTTIHGKDLRDWAVNTSVVSSKTRPMQNHFSDHIMNGKSSKQPRIH